MLSALARKAGVAGRLEGRHQRFGQVHVGVLAAIVGERRPVLVELLGARAVRLVPEARLENLRDVGEQRVGVGMADAFGARRRQQDEGVAIGELVALARAVVVERPEIAAVLGVAMALADRLHAVIDDVGGAGPAEQMGDGEAMDHARRLVQRPHAVARQRPAARVEIGEAALGDRSDPARRTPAANRPRRRASGGGRGGRARMAAQRARSWFGVSSAAEFAAFCCADASPPLAARGCGGASARASKVCGAAPGKLA